VPGDESDERLFERFRRGDAGAFELLVRRHRAPLFTFLVRLGVDRPRAEDVLQDTWLRAVSAAQRWEPRARFRTWLYTVARNLAADEARRAATRRAVPLADPPVEGAPPPLDGAAAPDPGPDRRAASAEIRPRLEAALAALPEEQREVFVLREYAGVPFAEIAAITGAPQPTVKSRMRYALEGLRRSLAELGVGAGDAAPGSTGT
jgi:RNA polymerase sigma-70 factor (ECF subfamily)